MNWMLMPYRRYFDFAGRSRRKEYWMFALLGLLVWVVWFVGANAVMATSLNGTASVSGTAMLVTGLVGLWGLLSFIPAIAVAVRRLHDGNRSGWWLLIGLVPFVGGLVLLYFYLIEGTRGPNRFGPDPKEGEVRGV